MSKLTISVANANKTIAERISKAKELKNGSINSESDLDRTLDFFENWITQTETTLKSIFSDDSIAKSFVVEEDIILPTVDESLSKKTHDFHHEIDIYINRLDEIKTNLKLYEDNTLILKSIKESKFLPLILGATFIIVTLTAFSAQLKTAWCQRVNCDKVENKLPEGDKKTKDDITEIPTLIEPEKKISNHLISKDLVLGREWNDSNTRAWIKFESLNKNLITVLVDLKWDGTNIETLQFESNKSLTYEASSKKYDMKIEKKQGTDSSLTIQISELK